MLLRDGGGRKMQADQKNRKMFSQGTYLSLAWAVEDKICLDLWPRIEGMVDLLVQSERESNFSVSEPYIYI